MKPAWNKIEFWTLILVAVTLPISIAAANVMLGIAVLLVILKLLRHESSVKELLGGVTIPLMICVFIEFIAIFLSGYPHHILDFFEDKWVLSAYFVAFILGRERAIVERALTVQVIAGAVVAVYALYQFIFGWDILRQEILEETGRRYMAVAQFSHHLTYGGIALITFMIALTAVLFNTRRKRSLYGWLLTALCAAGLLVSYARSAMVGAAAGIIVIILLLKGKLRFYLILGSVAGMILMFLVVPGMQQRFVNIGQNEGSRVRLWLTSIEIIKHHPVFGVGQSNFGEAFEKYHIPGEYESKAHSHNDFLSVAVEGGIFTLLAFILIWVVYFRKVIPLIKVFFNDESMKWIYCAGLTVVISILVASQFQNYLTDAEVANMIWFNVGLILGMKTSETKSNHE